MMRRREVLLLAGGAMAMARPLRAQQKAMPMIGFLSAGSPGPLVAAFHRGLSETGWVEGKNVAVEYRWAEGHYDRLPALAADLVSRNVELVPRARVIALLVNPKNPSTESMIRDVQEAARAKGVQLQILNAGNESEIDDAFATLVQLHVDALLVGTDSFFYNRREQLVTLAARHAVPAIYDFREFAESGGLISYGTSLIGIYRQIGIYVGQILKGAKPADLPVQQPTIFELVVNLKTAKALGLTITPSILARVDEIIE